MNDRPPILGTWRNLHALVIAVLIVEIALMYLLTVYLR